MMKNENHRDTTFRSQRVLVVVIIFTNTISGEKTGFLFADKCSGCKQQHNQINSHGNVAVENSVQYAAANDGRHAAEY